MPFLFFKNLRKLQFHHMSMEFYIVKNVQSGCIRVENMKIHFRSHFERKKKMKKTATKPSIILWIVPFFMREIGKKIITKQNKMLLWTIILNWIIIIYSRLMSTTPKKKSAEQLRKRKPEPKRTSRRSDSKRSRRRQKRDAALDQRRN